MCIHGDAGLGKTLSVNASLRALAPDDVCRVQFRARPTPRDIRHVCSTLSVSVGPPDAADRVRRAARRRFGRTVRVLVCDEAQWLSRECFELWRHLWDDRRTDIAIVSSAAATATGCCAASRCCPAGSTCGRSSAG